MPQFIVTLSDQTPNPAKVEGVLNVLTSTTSYLDGTVVDVRPFTTNDTVHSLTPWKVKSSGSTIAQFASVTSAADYIDEIGGLDLVGITIEFSTKTL